MSMAALLVWFVGRLVYISGLKKKMVSVAEKGSHTMFLSSTNTAMAWCPAYKGNLPMNGSPEKCGGVYAGVITGIYLQGMVVELDDTVWMLIDDLLLLPPHSLRVGAVVCSNLYLEFQNSILRCHCSYSTSL